MMCYCSAVWKPEPSFYPKRVEMSYTVEGRDFLLRSFSVNLIIVFLEVSVQL